MLSPSVRQVTHALLTRPPLTYQSLGFMISPFDLHVLSTPPAFILSQDQTLMLKFSTICCLSCQLFIWLTVFWVVTWTEVLITCSLKSRTAIPSLSTGVPPDFLALRSCFALFSWNFQGCITVYLSRFIITLSCCNKYVRHI